MTAFERFSDWLGEHYVGVFLLSMLLLVLPLVPRLGWARTLLVWGALVGSGGLIHPMLDAGSNAYGEVLVRLDETRPVVALTFDDGPAEDTPALLDLLGELDVAATFFVIGANVRRRPELVWRAHTRGHLVANHTERHRNLLTLSPEGARREIEQGAEAIHQVLGVEPRLFRPPYGFRAPWILGAARRAGQRTVTWSVNPRDFLRLDGAEIARRVIEAVRPGDIVLLHDGPADRGRTLEAVRLLVPALRQRGFQFVRLDEGKFGRIGEIFKQED